MGDRARDKGSASKRVGRVSVTPPVWGKDPYPRVHPGRYLVRVVGWQGPEWVRSLRRWSLRLECALVDEPVSLSVFFNFGGTPEHLGTPGRLSKYYRHWVMANREPPRKHQPMDWAIFVDKWFTAEVEDASKDGSGREKCEADIYSRISQFIRLEQL